MACSTTPNPSKKQAKEKEEPLTLNQKKKSNSDKKYEIQPLDLFEQKPLILVTLEEFFPNDFLRKVEINMVLCSCLLYTSPSPRD